MRFSNCVLVEVNGSVEVSQIFAKDSQWCEDKNWSLLTLVLGEGNGNPLQYSCLENPMDGGAWWVAVHGVTRSRTRLSDFTFTFHFHALEKEMDGNPLQCSCLENPRDGGAWWAAVSGIAQSRTRLN